MAAKEDQSAVGSNTSKSKILPAEEEDPKPGPTEYELMYPTNHLFVLSPTNPFRRLCVRIGTSKVGVIIIFLINNLLFSLKKLHCLYKSN